MSNINWNITVAQAYAEGYYDGRNKGEGEDNPYYESSMRYAYRMGYEKGISAYCLELEENDHA